jgi:hypothetical protein
MSQILWTQYFMEAQGYTVDQSLVAQDNLSAMLLENNGRASSSSKRTRHINIRYFFVTDRIKSGEVSMTYCPTDDMIADYFTKSLQGTKFRDFRNFIMNVDPSTDSVVDRRSVLGIINPPGTQNKLDGVGADVHTAHPPVHPIKSQVRSNLNVRIAKSCKEPRRRQ